MQQRQHTGISDNQSAHSMASSFYDANNQTSTHIGSERVRVAMRLRPMMPHELGRQDKSIVSVSD